MTVKCEICDGEPVDNDTKFYSIRITEDGKTNEIFTDYILCGPCLAEKLDSFTKRGKIQSIRRIENPMM